jgi:hypothetical protein
MVISIHGEVDDASPDASRNWAMNPVCYQNAG